MTPWLLITVLLAVINLAAFLVVRGRWGRIAPLLGVASLLGTVAGNAVGEATGLDVLVLGDYHVLAACIGAQLLMLGSLLLVAMLPTADERAESSTDDR